MSTTSKFKKKKDTEGNEGYCKAAAWHLHEDLPNTLRLTENLGEFYTGLGLIIGYWRCVCNTGMVAAIVTPLTIMAWRVTKHMYSKVATVLITQEGFCHFHLILLFPSLKPRLKNLLGFLLKRAEVAPDSIPPLPLSCFLRLHRN